MCALYVSTSPTLTPLLTIGIIELHSGTLSAFSRGEGQGCTFTVELPMKSRAALEEVVASSYSDVGGGGSGSGDNSLSSSEHELNRSMSSRELRQSITRKKLTTNKSLKSRQNRTNVNKQSIFFSGASFQLQSSWSSRSSVSGVRESTQSTRIRQLSVDLELLMTPMMHMNSMEVRNGGSSSGGSDRSQSRGSSFRRVRSEDDVLKDQGESRSWSVTSIDEALLAARRLLDRDDVSGYNSLYDVDVSGRSQQSLPNSYDRNRVLPAMPPHRVQAVVPMTSPAVAAVLPLQPRVALKSLSY